jgi:Tfp pilus assembly protein FimV
MKNLPSIATTLPWLLALPAAVVLAQPMPDTARALKTLMEGSHQNNGHDASAAASASQASQGTSMAIGHVVRPGETLARVVHQVYGSHPYKDAPVFRLIVQRNPDAFIGGNHNRLRAGAQLLLPSPAELHAALTAQHPQFQVAAGRPPGADPTHARGMPPAGAAKPSYPGSSAAAAQATAPSDARRGWVRFP